MADTQTTEQEQRQDDVAPWDFLAQVVPELRAEATKRGIESSSVASPVLDLMATKEGFSAAVATLMLVADNSPALAQKLVMRVLLGPQEPIPAEAVEP